MPTGLIRRGGRYSLRRRIPVDLVAHYKRAEITIALRTADPKEARRLLPLKWAELDTQFELVRSARQTAETERLQPISPTERALHYLDRLRADRDAAFAAGTLAEFTQELRGVFDQTQRMLTGEVPTKQRMADLEGVRNAIQALLVGDNAFAVSAARKARKALEEAEERNLAPEASWAILIDKWAVERSQSAKTRQAHEAVVRWFTERLGERAVQAVTKADVIRFKDALVSEGATASNINVKLTRLRTLLNYAFDNDLIASRPAAGVSVQTSNNAATKRRPFDEKALAHLFGGPVHSAGERPTRGRGEAAYWLPILALYTGARLEEMGQLRPADIARRAFTNMDGSDGETWLIQFDADQADRLKLKTANSERQMPIHAELERLGFLTFVEQARANGQSRIFPALRPDVHGRLTAKWGEWFSTYLRTTCGVSDKRIVFHSFRHTFKDNARNSGLSEPIQRQLMGHSGSGVADSYGEGFGLSQLVDAMKRYRTLGISLVTNLSSATPNDEPGDASPR